VVALAADIEVLTAGAFKPGCRGDRARIRAPDRPAPGERIGDRAAYDINEAGRIVGTYTDGPITAPEWPSSGSLLTGGVFTHMGHNGTSYESVALSINDQTKRTSAFTRWRAHRLGPCRDGEPTPCRNR
jgi:hypothetical protein